MNRYIYSPLENAFYAVALRTSYEVNGTWPVDAVEISDDISAVYMAEPPEEKTRAAGSDGYPVWINKPQPTQEELIDAANADKLERIEQTNEFMNSKQWPGKAAIGRLKGDELASYNLWLDYLDALEGIKTCSAPNIVWPEPPAE